MKKADFKMEVISRCLAGGADNEQNAEIRVPTIRGQLRWWFRLLDGFKSMSDMPLRQQEIHVFGGIGDGKDKSARSSKLRLKIRGTGLTANSSKNWQSLGIGFKDPESYLLFPARQNPKAMFDFNYLPSFSLQVTWTGHKRHWEDIRALISVSGHLGSLGSRGRRAMGALAFSDDSSMALSEAFDKFNNPDNIIVRQLKEKVHDPQTTTVALANWLKGWRSHGRSPRLSNGPGFPYAKNDHDMGNGTNPNGVGMRPTLGLPIVQFYSSTRKTSNWEESDNRKDKGRFASPVLLRPYRSPRGEWKALVLFIEKHKWPKGKKVYLNGQPRDVSLDLYEAMKNDERLEEIASVDSL